MKALSRLIARYGHFHPPTVDDLHGDWYKEWYHFCILGPEAEAIVNFNLSGDTHPSATPGRQLARVILLTHDDGWEGDVDTIPFRDARLHTGLLGLTFGHNSVRYENGTFHLSAALQNRPVTLVAQLKPTTLPLLMRSNTRIGEGKINWLVVPRLEATGTLTVGDRVHRFEGAPAYHDHNWGRWLWGHDLAWQWGFALPEAESVPWSIVFDRTTNRARTRVLELTLALWRGGKLARVFTQDEVRVRRSGYLQPEALPKFPRVMALIAPEATGDIPHRLELTGTARGDNLHVVFAAEDLAQIVVPNETDLGVTVINEVTGRITASGKVRGERVALEGRGIFEFLT